MKRLTSLPDRRTAAVTMSPAESVELDSSWPRRWPPDYGECQCERVFQTLPDHPSGCRWVLLYHSIVNFSAKVTLQSIPAHRWRLATKQVRSHPEIYAGFIMKALKNLRHPLKAAIDGAAKSKFVPSAMRCSYALKFSMRINDWSMESISVLFKGLAGPVESTMRIALLRSNGNHFDALRRRPSKVDRPAMTTCLQYFQLYD